MLEIIKRHSLTADSDSVLNKVIQFNMKKLKNTVAGASVIALLFAFFWLKSQNNFLPAAPKTTTTIANNEAEEPEEMIQLPLKVNNENGLSIEAKPVNFSFGEPAEFEISFETHQGDLNFDLTEQSVLIDGKGNEYLPLEWRGGAGGHHLTGILVFPPILKETEKIKIIINNVYGAKERVFEWDLK